MDRAAATDLIERTAETAGTVAASVIETAIDRAGDVVDTATDVVQRAMTARGRADRTPWFAVVAAVGVLALGVVLVAKWVRRRRAGQVPTVDARDEVARPVVAA